MRLSCLLCSAWIFTVLTPEEGWAVEAGHDVSITMSPFHLFFPMGELTAEVRLPMDFSVAGIAGVGSFEGTPVWEAGAQARYYLIGGFEHGMPLGIEALYLGARDDFDGVRVNAAGLAVGPFIGYKFASQEGFTVDLAGGVQYLAYSASATDGTRTERDSDWEVFPLINLNLGWSF